MTKEEEDLVYETMIQKNEHSYNILKAAEELQELSLVLIQSLSKGVDEKEIIDEIGDVKIRLKVLSKLFPEDKIKERVKYKLNKYLKYISLNKYKNI